MRTATVFSILIGVAGGGAAFYAKQMAANPVTSYQTVAIKRGDPLSTIIVQGPPAGGGPDFNRGPPGSLPLAMLAMQKSVQGELKLDKTQKQRLQELDAKLEKGDGRANAATKQAGDGRRTEAARWREHGRWAPAKRCGKRRQTGAAGGGRGERSERVGGNPVQNNLPASDRLRCSSKDRALLAPERVKELELTEKQQERIRRLIHNDAKSASGVLNAEQQAKWREMTGRPFRGKIAFPPPMTPMPRN